MYFRISGCWSPLANTTWYTGRNHVTCDDFHNVTACTSLDCHCLPFQCFSLIGHKTSVSCGTVFRFSSTSGCLRNLALAITTPAAMSTVTLTQNQVISMVTFTVTREFKQRRRERLGKRRLKNWTCISLTNFANGCMYSDCLTVLKLS